MANPSLPSFVELMASLGLQDEHTANALLRGATADTATPVTPSPIYRQSTDSLGTPLSSASLVTPLSSPSVQRDRPTSHGKKRYSPYGLSAISSGEIYTRRGSVPDLLSQAHYGQDRRLHHLSAPEPFHDHSSNSGRATDEDGDEEMEDAVPATRHHNRRPYKPSSSLHCAGQPNLLISRQRMRPAAASVMPRTKSHSHMRTTSVTTQQQQRPPIDMPMDTERTNDGDIAVVSISSLLRRSHPQSRPPVVATSPTPAAAAAAVATVAAAAAPGPPATGSTQSLDSPRGFQFPPAPSSGPTSTLSPAPPHRTPPSAPPTKTSFGFLPAGPAGNISATSISATRRARHARSSSARSVRDMIRERETNVLLAPLHSFHPMGETEEERDGSLKHTTSESSRVRPQSTGQLSAHSTATEDGGGSTKSVPAPSSTSAQSSFLPLDDSSRSFSHRRRVKRHTAEAATPRAGGKRSSPPPPLMLPTLSFNIRALVGGTEREGADKDRLAVAGASDTGYVSRREPHSPDPRGSWRRRAAPLEVAGV